MSISSDDASDSAEQVGDFLGLPPIQDTEVGPLAIALGVALLSIAAGWLAWRPIRGWLEKVADRLGPERDKALFDSERIAKGLGQLMAAVVLLIVTAVWDWPPYAELAFHVAIASVVALTAYYLVMGVFGSRSAALAVAVVVAAVTITKRYAQLDEVGESLDSISLSLGTTTVSLLGVVNLAVGAVVLYAVVKVVARVARVVIRSRTNLDKSQRDLTEKLTMIALGVISVLVAIDLAGIDTTALSIFSGTIGVGLGFGLQKVVSNFVSGIVLLWDRSVKPGDTIVIDTTDVAGEVIKVGTRAVSVVTRDGKVHLIPNELLMTERVENWGYDVHRVRLRMAISVEIGSDYDLVQQLMVEAATEQGRVLTEPAPRVRITGVNDNGVDHELRFWITDPDQGLGNVRSATYRSLLDKFAEHDVAISNLALELAVTDARLSDAFDSDA